MKVIAKAIGSFLIGVGLLPRSSRTGIIFQDNNLQQLSCREDPVRRGRSLKKIIMRGIATFATSMLVLGALSPIAGLGEVQAATIFRDTFTRGDSSDLGHAETGGQ